MQFPIQYLRALKMNEFLGSIDFRDCTKMPLWKCRTPHRYPSRHLRLLAEGMSNGEIAKTRFVSEKSVEQIVARIALNMGIVPNRKKNLRVLMTTNSIAGWDRLKLLSGIVALMDLADIRSKWSEVLNQLEKNNRTAWLVYFDARLANWDGNKLTLDFSDSDKLGYGIEYNDKRAKYLNELQDAIRTVCGIDAEILT